jgi:site-specific recombinase XerD
MSMKMSKRRQNTDGQVIAHPGIASTPFESALEAFLKAQDAAGHSKVTQDDYKRVVKPFLRYMVSERGYTYIQEITEHDIFAWLSYLRNTPNRLNKPYSSRTIETYCRNVLVFFNWLLEHHYLTVNPIAQVKLPKTEKALIRVFTEDELERLDAACDRAPQGRSLTSDERKAMSARDRAM